MLIQQHYLQKAGFTKVSDVEEEGSRIETWHYSKEHTVLSVTFVDGNYRLLQLLTGTSNPYTCILPNMSHIRTLSQLETLTGLLFGPVKPNLRSKYFKSL